MFTDQLFCFTPKGELIQLPRGSTPVDFAYAVHTTLGDRCVGARVNGKVVPLRTRLANGDQVEILRSSAQTPDPLWDSFVVTAKARAAVRRHQRQRERQAQQKTGEALFHDTVRRLKLDVAAESLQAALKRLKLADQPALFSALARQSVSEAQLMDALVPGSSAKRRARRRTPAEGADSAILVDGESNAGGMEMAPCCMPVPGDRIVGVRAAGRGILVHTIDCQALAMLEEPDLVGLKWAPDVRSGTARIEVVVMNEPGALAQVTAVLAQQGANIVNLQLRDRDRAHHRFVMDVEVDDLRHLSELVVQLRLPALVVSADRLQGVNSG